MSTILDRPRVLFLALIAGALVGAAQGNAQTGPLFVPETIPTQYPQHLLSPRQVDFDATGLLAVQGYVAPTSTLTVWKRNSGTWSAVGSANVSAAATRFVRYQGDAGGVDLLFSEDDFPVGGSLGRMNNSGVGTFPTTSKRLVVQVGQVWDMFGPAFLTTSAGTHYYVVGASDLRSWAVRPGDGAIVYAALPLGSAAPVIEPMPHPLQHVTMGDFNSDGRPDLAIVDFDPVAYVFTLKVRYGLAGGTWTAWTTLLGNSSGIRDLATGDVDGDGKTDLVVNEAGLANRVWHGSAAGLQSPAPIPSASPDDGFTRTVLADLNGDGRPDLVRAGYFDLYSPNIQAYGFWIAMNDGTGHYLPDAFHMLAHDVPRVNVSFEVAVSDYDGDGKPDVVFSDHLQGLLTVFPGDGHGGFRDAPYSVALSDDVARTIAAGDIDGDGRNDLAVGFDSDTTSIGLLRSLPSGGFAPRIGLDAGLHVSHLAIRDLGNSGSGDLVVGRDDAPIGLMLNGGGMQLNPLNPLDPFDTSQGPATLGGLGVGRIAAGAPPAIVAAIDSPTDPHLELRLPQPFYAFDPEIRVPQDARPVGLVLGGPDVDGLYDSITVTTGEPYPLPSRLETAHLDPISYETTVPTYVSLPYDPIQHSPHPIALTRFGPGAPRTLVLLDESGALAEIDEDGGLGGWTDQGWLALPGLGRAVAEGDLDGDGIHDVAVACPWDNVVAVFTGALAIEHDYTFDAPVDVQIADINGDHLNDLVVLSSPAFVANAPARPARSGATIAGRREIHPARVTRVPVMRTSSAGSAMFALTGTGLQTTLGVPHSPPANASLAFAVAPNPARGSARLDFTVPGGQRARVELFDVTGRRVATLFDGIAAAGSHRVTWEGKDAAGRPMADGVYLARLTTGTMGATRHVVWLH